MLDYKSIIIKRYALIMIEAIEKWYESFKEDALC